MPVCATTTTTTTTTTTALQTDRGHHADLSLRSDLVLGLLPGLGPDQLQQAVLVQDGGTKVLRLRSQSGNTREAQPIGREIKHR